MGKNRLKIELTEVSAQGWHYRVLEEKEDKEISQPNGIFEGIFKETGGEPEKNKDIKAKAQLWLVVHPISEFLCGEETINGKNPPFAQDLLILQKEDIRQEEQQYPDQLPIIHITTTDLFLPSMYTSKPQHRLVPRYYLIIDNSIWNYHVSIFNGLIRRDENTKTSKKPIELAFKKSFLNALESIKKNFERHLYNLQVAQEYADLNARMSTQAYLIGAHAKGVSPFVFHSEGVVKQMIQDEFGEEAHILDKIKGCKWRLLLVDDKAVEKMESNPKLPNEIYNNLPWNCKLTIIENTLRHQFGWEKGTNKIQHRPWDEEKDCTKDCQILIEYAQTLVDAEKAIKKKTYDIVLLDYLLDTDDNYYQNYGFSLLNDIYNDRDKSGEFKEFKPRPSQRFFFMFISAYTTAVYERTRAETLNLSEDYWHISLGACPTNTPQLFLYYLLKLMDKRLDDSGIYNLETEAIVDLLTEIYKKDSIGAVRRRANAKYKDVLSLQYYFKNLLEDVAIPRSGNVFDTNGSVLVTDFMRKHPNLGGLLEHIVHLVHLTAFGTIRQWHEMWEEYIFIKTILNAERQVSSSDIATTNEVKDNQAQKDLFTDIEEYILKLKTQQQ